MKHFLRCAALLTLASASLAPQAFAGAAPRLAVVAWRDGDDLADIEGTGRVRYVTPGAALVAVDDDGSGLRARGFDVLVVDAPPSGHAYFLADHVHGGEPGDAALADLVEVWRAPDGWSLMRLPKDRLVDAIDRGHWLYPLPASYPLPRPAAVAKPLARPASAAVRALLDQVDTERLRRDVERLAFVEPEKGAVLDNVRSRFARRPEARDSAEQLRAELAAVLGSDAVRLDSFRIADGDSLMVNVVGELAGTDPQAGYWVVCGHYDATGTRSRPSDMARIGESDRSWDWRRHPAPGADDNGTGVAVVLESARVLSQRRFPWGVRFIAWSGEELGLWGSKHYAEAAHARSDHILGVLNFDMIGFNDLAPRLELVSNPQSSWLVELMQATSARYELGLDLDHLEDRFAGLSDHAPFWAAGYDAILGIENYLPDDSLSAGVIDGQYRINTQYHTVADLPDSVNWELVADIARLSVATLAQFGAEEGQPNLAVFGGDLQTGTPGHLVVQVANLGPVDLQSAFDLRVSRCDADSSGCSVLFDGSQPGPLAAGAVARLEVPWPGLGTNVFLVEVDPNDRIVEEVELSDNRVFVRVRLVPKEGLAIFPNPFRAGAAAQVSFSGVPRYSRLRLYGAAGDLVWSSREEDQPQGNEIRWTGVNSAGYAVSPGIYLYDLRSFEGELLERGKIAVVR